MAPIEPNQISVVGLSLMDVAAGDCERESKDVHLVSSADSPEFSHLINSLNRSSLIGLDAEWKPTRRSEIPESFTTLNLNRYIPPYNNFTGVMPKFDFLNFGVEVFKETVQGSIFECYRKGYGEGCHETIYKAKLVDGGTIALRLLREESSKEKSSCLPSIKQLGRILHENLIPLRAFILADETFMIFYKKEGQETSVELGSASEECTVHCSMIILPSVLHYGSETPITHGN
ncbi:hypothetical protein QQ045_010921 [Rhodiola kirilowii]